jgi:hypothetical protein
MQQCKHFSEGEFCRLQQMSYVNRDSPVRRIIIDTGRIVCNSPELSYHMIHESNYVESGLCYYHEKIRLGLITKPHKHWRKW